MTQESLERILDMAYTFIFDRGITDESFISSSEIRPERDEQWDDSLPKGSFLPAQLFWGSPLKIHETDCKPQDHLLQCPWKRMSSQVVVWGCQGTALGRSPLAHGVGQHLCGVIEEYLMSSSCSYVRCNVDFINQGEIGLISLLILCLLH